MVKGKSGKKSQNIMKLIVDIVSSFHPILFKGKKVKRTWENDKKPPDSHPIFAHLSRICAPNLCVCVCVRESFSFNIFRHYCKLSLYAISRKKCDPNSTEWWKTSFSVRRKFGPPNFFLKNLAQSVTRYQGQLSSYTISEKKIMIQSWKYLVTDGQTDGQQWFHRTLSD